MGKNRSLFSHTHIKKNKIYVCLDWLFSLFLCENKLTHFRNICFFITQTQKLRLITLNNKKLIQKTEN